MYVESLVVEKFYNSISGPKSTWQKRKQQNEETGKQKLRRKATILGNITQKPHLIHNKYTFLDCGSH